MKRIPNAAYTLEFKLEALRRVRGGEPVRRIAREVGVPEQSIRNWVKAQVEGKLGSTEKEKPITPEHPHLQLGRTLDVRQDRTPVPIRPSVRFPCGESTARQQHMTR